MKVVATNGVFSFLHAGHVEYLRVARYLGDKLIVGINDDFGARTLKGRCIQTAEHRSLALQALRFVDEVHIFEGTCAAQWLESIEPNIYVKGGDYSLKKLSAPERIALQRMKTAIVFIPETIEVHCSDFLQNL